MSDPTTFGSRLRALREARHLTVADLAQAVSMARTTIYLLESDGKAPLLQTALALAVALGVRPADLPAFLGYPPG